MLLDLRDSALGRVWASPLLPSNLLPEFIRNAESRAVPPPEDRTCTLTRPWGFICTGWAADTSLEFFIAF